MTPNDAPLSQDDDALPGNGPWPRVVSEAPPPDTDEARSLIPHPRARTHIRSFALRLGKITPAQKAAHETLMPRHGLPYQATPVAFPEVFGREAPCVLEIGCGMGETTAAIAAAHPDTDFVGVEVFTAGVGSLLKRIEEQSLSNLRVVQHDAVEVVRDMIPADALAGVHVYFPDPWHKSRHNKRRLIQPAFVAMLARRIRPGGYLHCATDWEDYALQMLEVLSGESRLANRAGPVTMGETAAACTGWSERPAWRPATKFERRGLKLGHGVWDLVFERLPD